MNSTADFPVALPIVRLLCSAFLVSACVGDTEKVDTAPIDSCPTFTGAPTDHSGFIEADETWAAGLHTVSYNVMVGGGITLTVAPCASVALAADQSIFVNEASAKLIAEGTAGERILFERSDPAVAWGNLSVMAPGTVSLAYATLIGGGGTGTDPVNAVGAGATLMGRNQQGQPYDTLSVDHVTIEGSTGLGVLLDSTGFIAGSNELTVTGSGRNPVYLGAGYATHLPVGHYSGNADDRFLLQEVGAASYSNSEPILADATIPNRGLPYLVGAEGTYPSILVGDGREESPNATLTLEPGVELLFQGGEVSSGGLRVSGKSVYPNWAAQGSLVARGTAAKPIVMRSAEEPPRPGDWQGLYFQYVVSPSSALSFVEVSNAGGESLTSGVCVAAPGAENYDADCSVVMSLEQAPGASFITDSTFADGRACGIYRGWTGAAVDFSATNTFTNLSGCDQSNVYDDAARECSGGTCE